jgi:hypothetical protein
MDSMIAGELGVDVETYIDVIENRCTLEEADFIIYECCQPRNVEAAKKLFNSKLN